MVNSELASRVCHGLWMGGVPPIGMGVSQYFDCLVLAAKEYQYEWDYPDVEVIAVPLDDSGNPMSKAEMVYAIRAAGTVIRWLNEDKSVLVTCRMGRNRSGLICALALCCGPTAVTPEQAVRTIRAARGPSALGNRHFLSFLDEFCSFRSSGGQSITERLLLSNL